MLSDVTAHFTNCCFFATKFAISFRSGGHFLVHMKMSRKVFDDKYRLSCSIYKVMQGAQDQRTERDNLIRQIRGNSHDLMGWVDFSGCSVGRPLLLYYRNRPLALYLASPPLTPSENPHCPELLKAVDFRL